MYIKFWAPSRAHLCPKHVPSFVFCEKKVDCQSKTKDIYLGEKKVEGISDNFLNCQHPMQRSRVPIFYFQGMGPI